MEIQLVQWVLWLIQLQLAVLPSRTQKWILTCGVEYDVELMVCEYLSVTAVENAGAVLSLRCLDRRWSR